MAARIPPSEQERLESLRTSHLQSAIKVFTELCDGFERIDMVRLSMFDGEMLRRAYLYRGDCAYYLGDLELAIRLYDFAARKYSLHHSSMYALVQIVNCYAELGLVTRARTAHRRALVRLEQLPETTFFAPDSLRDRNAWERWLENHPVAPTKTASALPTG